MGFGNLGIDEVKKSISDKGSPFWIGKVVSIESQKEQTSGVKAWGIRYKVRLMGDYSARDDVEDKDVIYATCALGVTDGSGGAGKLKTSKISQGDTVTGIFLSADEQGPIIQNVLPRSAVEVRGDGKFDAKSGFTDQTKEGLLGKQEFNEQDNVATPGLKDCKGSQKGRGTGRSTPVKGLQKMGIDPNLKSQVNALKKPLSSVTDALSSSSNDSSSSQKISDLVSSMKGQGNAAAYTEIESVKGTLTNRDRFLIKEKMRIEELAVEFVNTNTGPDKDFDTFSEATKSSQYKAFMDQVKVIDEELNN